MQQRLSIITLGAENLQAMRQFYVEKFGGTPVAENKDIIFFKMNGFLFSLFGRRAQAEFHGMSSEGSGFRPVTLAYMVNSKEEVEILYTSLTSKGVTIIKEPSVPPIGGYYFLFTDIEGNAWEIALNPFIPLDENGDVITHESIDQIE